MSDARKPCTWTSLALSVFVGCLMLLGQGMVWADWDPGDGYKMHYPQLPKPGGLDVEFVESTLADDWLCTESGPVTDIHFWVSWMADQWRPIDLINVGIFSDILADPQDPTSYSMPGQPLWTRTFEPDRFTVRPMAPDFQDWFDPSQQWPGNFGLDDHDIWQQINIEPITDPFIQEAGTIYWLAVNIPGPFVGWKESESEHFNDDAVWWNEADEAWIELRHPDPTLNYSLDLAFVITTPEPGAVALLLPFLGCMLLMRRRR